MNQLANRNTAGAIMQQPAIFDTLPEEWDDLTANVSIGFPIIGIKAGRWHYRWKGEDQIIMDASGRFPAPAIQVIILKAQKELSRTFYPGGYVEGVNNPPECWSSNGIAPDQTVAVPQNPVCAACPNAAWGSGATPAAPKAQACQQRRRTVVIPYSTDLTNEAGGGPCLLSVPPGSLTNFVGYGNRLRDNRIHYAGQITELSFTQDPNIAFPKIEFNNLGSVSDAEGQIIVGMRSHEAVDRILNTTMVQTELDGAVDPGQPTTQAAPPPVAQPKAPAPPPIRTAPPPPPPRANTPSAVKPPVAQAKPAAQPAAKAPLPPPQPTARVGGFNVAPAATVAAATAAQAPIATAVGRPAPPPPTARKVAPPPPPPVEEVEVQAEETEPEVTEEQVEGQVPDEMTTAFDNLMAAT